MKIDICQHYTHERETEYYYKFILSQCHSKNNKKFSLIELIPAKTTETSAHIKKKMRIMIPIR